MQSNSDVLWIQRVIYMHNIKFFISFRDNVLFGSDNPSSFLNLKTKQNKKNGKMKTVTSTWEILTELTIQV